MNKAMNFSILAILHEINEHELRKKLAAIPEDLHYYVTLASSIVGSENSKRIGETPDGVAQNSRDFVSGLLGIANTGPETPFKEILENCLVDTLKDELRFCCFNCINFNQCLDAKNLKVGELFMRRVHGEETSQLRDEISGQIRTALKKTPYLDIDYAHRKCSKFAHNYKASNVGEVFGRYADIAAALRVQFGIDYTKVQQRMISINMSFVDKCNEQQGIIRS